MDKALKGGETAKAGSICDNVMWLKNNLERLVDYFRKNMEDAEGYFKDPEALSEALEVLSYRKSVVRSFIKALEQMYRMVDE